MVVSMYAQMSAGGVVENIVAADGSAAEGLGLTAVPDTVGLGWLNKDGAWSPPAPPVVPEATTADFKVDTVGYAAALAAASTATTVDSLRAAILALGASITPQS